MLSIFSTLPDMFIFSRSLLISCILELDSDLDLDLILFKYTSLLSSKST